jgi:hypothetical protein
MARLVSLVTLLALCLSLLAAPAPLEKGKNKLSTRTGDGFSKESPIWPEYLWQSITWRGSLDKFLAGNYEGKTLFVMGAVVEIDHRGGIRSSLTLGEVGTDVSDRCNVGCVFDGKHKAKLDKLPKDGYVVVKGIGKGAKWTEGSVFLHGCEIVRVHDRSPWGDTWVREKPAWREELKKREALKGRKD